MTEKTDYAELFVLNHILGISAQTAPTNVYLALFTTATDDTGAGTEVSGGGYARQVLSFAAPAAGSTSTNADVSFTASGANFGTITHIAIFDALAAGNMLYHSPIDTQRTVDDGETITFSSGNVTVTED